MLLDIVMGSSREEGGWTFGLRGMGRWAGKRGEVDGAGGSEVRRDDRW